MLFLERKNVAAAYQKPCGQSYDLAESPGTLNGGVMDAMSRALALRFIAMAHPTTHVTAHLGSTARRRFRPLHTCLYTGAKHASHKRVRLGISGTHLGSESMRLRRGHEQHSECERPPGMGIGGIPTRTSAIPFDRGGFGRNALRRATGSKRSIPTACRFYRGNRQPQHAGGTNRRMPVDIQAESRDRSLTCDLPLKSRIPAFKRGEGSI
jgi:hypothetical protein